MLSLRSIDEHNWFGVLALQIKPSQTKFVASPVNILARAYVYRNNNAQALAIYNDEKIIGVCLICELNDDLCVYELQQFLIDYRYQGRGFGKDAVKLVISMLKNKGKYSMAEACVHRDDIVALNLYKSVGFIDTKLRDRQVPESILLRYYLKDEEDGS
ncbi:MAG: GNAT family N-acetyltransferase [Christensenellaceae bacterium]|nr:GNAT family N-acetyltransferase [Christensenellaceae bacterium]